MQGYNPTYAMGEETEFDKYSPSAHDFNSAVITSSGDRVPLCSVHSKPERYEQHPDAQPRFLQGFEPRTPFVEEEDTVPVTPLRSIDRLINQRNRQVHRGSNTPSTTPWLVLSIISIVCWGWIVGFLALIFVCQAHDARNRGNNSAAHRSLHKARLVLLVAFFVGFLAWMTIGYRLYENMHETDSIVSNSTQLVRGRKSV